MQNVTFTYWPVGFFLGIFLSRLTDAFVGPFYSIVSIFLLVSSSSFKGPKLCHICFVATSGFFWAASHNAPYAKSSHFDVEHHRPDHLIENRYSFVRLEGHFRLVKKAELFDNSYKGGVRFKKGLGRSLYDQMGFFEGDGSSHHRKSLWQTSLQSFRGFILEKTYSFYEIQGWLLCVLLGDTRGLSTEVFNAFQESGLFHLLVISGMHIGLLSFLFLYLCLTPWKFLYFVRIISIKQYLVSRQATTLLIVFFVFFYGGALNYPSAVQRSFLFFAILTCQRNIWGPQRLDETILQALSFQMFLFPMGFVNPSNFLSWVNFLYCVHLYNKEKRGISLWVLLRLQIIMTISVAALLGKVSFVGIFLNMMVVPFYPFVYFCSLYTVLSPDSSFYFVDFAVELQKIFIATVLNIYQEQYHGSMAFFDLSDHHIVLRFFMILALFFFTLNTLRGLSQTSIQRQKIKKKRG